MFQRLEILCGAQRVIDFMRQVFDAEQLRRYAAEDGSVLHAEVLVDDTVVMIADAGSDGAAFPVWLHVYVPDMDETYRRALAAGGVSTKNRNGRTIPTVAWVCPPPPSASHSQLVGQPLELPFNVL